MGNTCTKDEGHKDGALVAGGGDASTAASTEANLEMAPSFRRTWHGPKLPFHHKDSKRQPGEVSPRRTWHGRGKSHHGSWGSFSPRRERSIKSARPASIRQNSNKSGGHHHAVGHFFQAIEEFFFPRMNHELFPPPPPAPKVRGGVLLEGCNDEEEHREFIRDVMERIRELHGQDGLAEIGLEYRMLPCEAHTMTRIEEAAEEEDESETTTETTGLDLNHIALGGLSPTSSSPDLVSTDFTACSIKSTAGSVPSTSTETMIDLSVHLPPPESLPHCHLCMRRLYYAPTSTLITADNRKKYIADGDMYEEVARLCQEYCHEIMCKEGKMEWVTIEADAEKEPICALVNSDHPMLVGTANGTNEMADRPSILIATGRGKVRAGIFSRQHLICSGLESATAVPIVREAMARRMNVIIPDPNVHGDRMGFVTFEKTMDHIASILHGGGDDAGKVAVETAQSVPLEARDLYVLSHSASGGHLARYLLDKSDQYLPHIRAIAFTDSTHNIQWAKSEEQKELYKLLESNKCVYFRCSKVRQENTSQWYLHRAGEEVQTDSFWQHRFGKIKTYWAGTNEHSLTNWYAHNKIWEHFDQQLSQQSRDDEPHDNFPNGHRPRSDEVIQL